MASVLRFEEHDFYSDDEEIEDFSKYLSDVDESEEIDIPPNNTENSEIPSEIEIPLETPENAEDSGESLLDSLLGQVLSEKKAEPPIAGLFDDLDDSEPEEIDRRLLDDADSGIETAFSASKDSASSESAEKRFDLDSFLQYMKEEEHAVSVDDVPDFASKRNVYGTSFNVRTGAIHRPPRFEFARRDARWIDSCKELTYDCNAEKSIQQLLSLGKERRTVAFGARIDVGGLKSTDVYLKTADEMAVMETSDIQRIVRDAFNSRRLAVVLLGCDAVGRVSGCELSAGKQDYLRLALDTAIQTEFVPPIENVLDVVDIHFLPVIGAPVDRFLIVIRVKQIRNRIYRLETSV